jgi:hypothetical protein
MDPSSAGLIRNYIEPWLCDALIEGFETHPELHTSGDYRARHNQGFEGLTCAPVPSDVVHIFEDLTDIAARRYNLSVDHKISMYTIGRYTPGGNQTWHRDYDPSHELGGRRVVSWSLLLSEPGSDFTGGEFEFENGPVIFGKGDALFFTATTLHRVCPVLTGRRYVVICFAGR